jgi:arabinose-5-phosphate isomerase
MPDGFEDRILQSARKVMEVEADAVRAMADRLDVHFVSAVSLLLKTEGRVVTTGVGKSGQVARRVASSLTSTGTPAFYLHPVEALHGDLGLVREGDVALVFSASGSSDEIAQLTPLFRRLNVPIVALTGDLTSGLAEKADLVLDCGVASEACPHNLAPTSSVATQSAMGDALAMALLDARGFSPEDFAELHPGGRLGRRLLMKVQDLMHKGDRIPTVSPDVCMREALVEMTSKRLGCTIVVNGTGALEGIFTDGDLRRLSQEREDFLGVPVGHVMGRKPHTIEQSTLASAALARMEEHAITQLVVVDTKDQPVGILHLHDLLRAGIV